jgi:hypothetical protein
MERRKRGTCLSCNAGWVHSRELCKDCYDRARYQGNIANYPACGAVPVPYLGWNSKRWDEHPTIPTGPITPAQLGITPDQHAILPGGRELARNLYESAERFAATWLAARERSAA